MVEIGTVKDAIQSKAKVATPFADLIVFCVYVTYI